MSYLSKVSKKFGFGDWVSIYLRSSRKAFLTFKESGLQISSRKRGVQQAEGRAGAEAGRWERTWPSPGWEMGWQGQSEQGNQWQGPRGAVWWGLGFVAEWDGKPEASLSRAVMCCDLHFDRITLAIVWRINLGGKRGSRKASSEAITIIQLRSGGYHNNPRKMI